MKNRIENRRRLIFNCSSFPVFLSLREKFPVDLIDIHLLEMIQNDYFYKGLIPTWV